MSKDRRVMSLPILALAIGVVGITIAYAALSTSLKIKSGTVTQNTFVWDIKQSSGTVPGVATGNSETTCGTATITDSSVTVDSVRLSKPGDKCSYPITVQNKGDVDANIVNITAMSPSGIACTSSGEGKLVCGNVVYKLTSDNTGLNVLSRGNQRILKNSGTSDFYLVVFYEMSSSATNEEANQSGAGFTIVYGQDK